MNMKLKGALLGFAAMLTVAATNIHAQTVVVFAGSSALYLEMGQAAASEIAGSCAWDDGSKTFTLLDNRGGLDATDAANAWVVWQPATAGSCSGSVASSSTVQVYVNTDSTVGARCYFASPRCTLTTTASAGAPANNGLTGVSESALPQSVITLINGTGNAGTAVSVGASDIRAEDSEFANLRTLTACGEPVATVNGVPAQYLGMGYSNGNQIKGATAVGNFSAGTGGKFNVMNFALTGTDPISGSSLLYPSNGYVQLPVAVTPVIVIVNPSDESGFGSEQVSNITSGILAGYLDGTYGATNDLLTQSYGASAGAYVFVREPLSGTYNTMEYNVVNTVQNQSSMDIGLAAYNANKNGNAVPVDYCTGTGGAGGSWPSAQNPLMEEISRNSITSSGTSYRLRVIGTGNMVKAVQGTKDALGYAFWSASNFSAANAGNTKYLSVDGVDPLFQTWVDGLVPTSGNGLLGDVSLAHVRDGSYPIWGEQEFIFDNNSSSPAYIAATTLAATGSKFLSPLQPDFIPYGQLQVVRSHFAPPGVTFPNSSTPCDGPGSSVSNSGALTLGSEFGGSVGGMVYTLSSDGAYNADNSSSCGNVAHRR